MQADATVIKTTTGGLALSHASMTAPPLHIPDEKGGAFKTELTIARDPNGHTEKILWWHADDPRATPHNHPWRFQSTIEAGGYTEDRYMLRDGVVVRDSHTYRVGDVNTVQTDVFHVVRDVLPGTRTHMRCGVAADGNEWGYMDPESGEYTRATKDPGFIDALRALNPHIRPK